MSTDQSKPYEVRVLVLVMRHRVDGPINGADYIARDEVSGFFATIDEAQRALGPIRMTVKQNLINPLTWV